MNQSPKNLTPWQREWWTPGRILCISLLLGLALYIYARPSLERWLGVDLPAIVNSEAPEEPEPDAGDAPDRQQSGQPATQAEGPESDFLEKIAPDLWRSPAGLIYGQGPRGEHRIEHVMRHTEDDRSRPVHGVFDTQSRDDLLRLIDEAWRQTEGDDPPATRRQRDERTEWTITMPREIGYVGGRDGRDSGNPRTNRLRLVLEDDRVITAYPIWPRRR